MFPQFDINLIHYNCYRYGSSLVQDQLNSSTLPSRSGSQATMQCSSSKRDEERIHKFLKEKRNNYENNIRSLLQFSNQIMLQFIPKVVNLYKKADLQSIINRIKLFMFTEVIIMRSHYSCFPNGGSLVQNQLKLTTLNSRSGS
jgi:hypothetical protein